MKRIVKLENGITLILDPVEHAKTVTMGLATRTGSVNETKEISGISHLIEHMMFKGTKTRSAAKLASDVERLGAQSNAFTSKEITLYYMRALASDFREASEILLDMFINSAFDPKEFAKEKKVVCEEMKMTADQPDEYILDLIEELVFKGQPLGNTILGNATSVRRVSRERVLEYIREQYTKDSTVVCVTGSFDEEEVRRIFGEGLSSLKAGKKHIRVSDESYEPSYVSKKKDIEQSHICLGIRGVGIGDPLRDALGLVNTAFGAGMSSRLFQNIREKKGLAYSVFSSMSNASAAGDFIIYAGVSHEKIDEALEGIISEIAKLKSLELKGEELEKVKRQVKSSAVFGQENMVNRMVRNARNYLLLGRVDEVSDIIKNIDAVGEDEIRRAVELISDPSRYSFALLSNKKTDARRLIRSFF